jgi:2,4-dienoyl-CoA reductase-like NADH-dependent reductase (Old Yellow Enzyme family)
MTVPEIYAAIEAFGQAARRVREAGFDAVQIHSAHGYLNSEFLSPLTNQRVDEWGGDLSNRMRFLRAVCAAVREKVGSDYPVLIKLGMQDGPDGGLTLEEGARVAGELQSLGIDLIETSSGIGKPGIGSVRKGVRKEAEEGYFLPFARAARAASALPIAVVGGFRSREVMERALQSGDADLISLCRPLIREPDLPNRMKAGLTDRSACLSANNCWALKDGDGIGCKCPK